MSCDFKPGDEVEKYREIGDELGIRAQEWSLPVGTRAVVQSVEVSSRGNVGLCLVGHKNGVCGHYAANWRKAAKRNDRLTIEAFSVIKDGQYEEPKRAPAKKREKVQ